MKRTIIFFAVLLSLIVAIFGIKTANFLFTGAVTGDIGVEVLSLIPSLNNIQVSSISTSGSTITFNTIYNTNSSISYGTSTSLGTNITNSSTDKSHKFVLTGLSSSTIYYYNLTVCSSTCNTAGPNTFTTSSTTVEDDEEETPLPAGGISSSGSSGSIIPTKIKHFEIKSEKLNKIIIKKNEEIEKEIKIKNNGDSTKTFTLEIVGLKDFIEIKEHEFELESGKQKIIKVNIYGKDIGVNSGKVIIKSDSFTEIVRYVLEVETKDVYFDLSIDIPSEFTQIKRGENVTFYVNLINIKDWKSINVEIEYFLKDLENKIIYSDFEEVKILEDPTFSKTVNIPVPLDTGDYVIIAQVKYGNSLGTSSRMFSVIEKVPLGDIFEGEIKPRDYIIIGLVMILVIIILITTYLHNKQLKKISKIKFKSLKKEKVKLVNKKAPERAKFNTDIRRKLDLVEKAYKKGYISKSAYQNTKKKLNNLLKKN